MEVFNDTPWCICRKEEGMRSRGNGTREVDSTHYSTGQVKTIVKTIGLNLSSEVGDQIAFYCPFHNNTHTPSCSINENSGAWICFNPACGESGTIVELVKRVMQINDFQALRLIMSHGKMQADAFEDELNSLLDDKPEFEEFPQETLDRLHADLFGNKSARDYFESRGINEESMKHFKLGYSNATNMVVTPVHSPDGLPVGIVGRSIVDKRFKNSNNLPKSKTLFNIHRAKRIGSNVIIVESNFDAIRVHQAGFPNVVATLGGHISQESLSLLNRYFNRVTIMTDSDSAGRELGNSIASRLRNKDILWASHEYGKIYPHDAKDAGDMTDEEIKACINNAVSNIEYQSWAHDKTK
jgi:DNA primase